MKTWTRPLAGLSFATLAALSAASRMAPPSGSPSRSAYASSSARSSAET